MTHTFKIVTRWVGLFGYHYIWRDGAEYCGPFLHRGAALDAMYDLEDAQDSLREDRPSVLR